MKNLLFIIILFNFVACKTNNTQQLLDLYYVDNPIRLQDTVWCDIGELTLQPSYTRFDHDSLLQFILINADTLIDQKWKEDKKNKFISLYQFKPTNYTLNIIDSLKKDIFSSEKDYIRFKEDTSTIYDVKLSKGANYPSYIQLYNNNQPSIEQLSEIYTIPIKEPNNKKTFILFLVLSYFFGVWFVGSLAEKYNRSIIGWIVLQFIITPYVAYILLNILKYTKQDILNQNALLNQQEMWVRALTLLKTQGYQDIESPPIDFKLKTGEKAYLALFETVYLEWGKQRKSYNYHGLALSIPIMRGVRYRVGQANVHANEEELLLPLDDGNFIYTNKRMLFIGNKANKSIPLSKIIRIDKIYLEEAGYWAVVLQQDSGKDTYIVTLFEEAADCIIELYEQLS